MIGSGYGPIEKECFLLLGYASLDILFRFYPEEIREKINKRYHYPKYHQVSILVLNPYDRDDIKKKVISSRALSYLPVFRSDHFQTKDGIQCEFAVFKLEDRLSYLQYTHEISNANDNENISTTLIATINRQTEELQAESLAALKKSFEVFNGYQSRGLIPSSIRIVMLGIGGNENKKDDLQHFLDQHELNGDIYFYSDLEQIDFDFFKKMCNEHLKETSSEDKSIEYFSSSEPKGLKTKFLSHFFPKNKEENHLVFSLIDNNDNKPSETAYFLRLKDILKLIGEASQKTRGAKDIKKIKAFIEGDIKFMGYGEENDEEIFERIIVKIKRQENLKARMKSFLGKKDDEVDRLIADILIQICKPLHVTEKVHVTEGEETDELSKDNLRQTNN